MMRTKLAVVTVLAMLALAACQSQPGSVEASGGKSSFLDWLRPSSKVDLPAGTTFRVRLDHALDTERNRAGDAFTATLDAPVSVREKIVIPKGARFTGHVTASQPSGRLKGRGYLALTLDSFEVNGQTYEITTSSSSRSTGSHKKRNLVLIGGGSGVGAVVGGLAGGGKGAAIGAAAGAGAGTAGAAATGKKSVYLPAETVLRFSLKEAIQVKG